MGAGERLSLGKGVEDRWPEREYDGCRNRSTERGWGLFSSKVFPPMRKSRLHPSIRVCNHAAHARYIESGKIERKDQKPRVSKRKPPPDSEPLPTVEEQGILESFSKLPKTERDIIRQLLEKSGPKQAGELGSGFPSARRRSTSAVNFFCPCTG